MNEITEVKAAANYKRSCDVCGQKPTVQLLNLDGSLYSNTDMCGACYYGESACIDPDEWVTT